MIKNLMSLSILALMTALTMVISGCGEDSSGSKVKFKLGVIEKLDATLINSNVKDILVSEDKKLAYVLDNRDDLWRVKLDGNAKLIHDKSNWQRLDVSNTGLDGTVSQFNKIDAETKSNRDIFLAKNGLVVTGLLNQASGLVNYIVVIKHDDTKPYLSWASDATHADPAVFPPNVFIRRAKTIIAEHDGVDYAIFKLSNDFITSVKLEKGAKIKGLHKLAGAGFVIDSIMVAEKGSTSSKPGKLFIVDTTGVMSIGLDKLGSDADAPAVDAEAASAKWRMDTTFTTVAGVSYGGGAATGAFSLLTSGVESAVPGSAGINNNLAVKNVVIKDGKLLISLQAAAHILKSYTGGVAIYDIATNKTTAPKLGGVDGPSFRLIDGSLLAVLSSSLGEYDEHGNIINMKISNTMIDANLYSKKIFKLGLDSETLFMLKNREAAPSFASFATIGDDVILYTSGRSAYSVHYEHREIAVKNTSGKPSESQE